MGSNFCQLGVATAFAAAALLIIAISLGTEHWVVVEVDRDDIKALVLLGGPDAKSINNSLRLDSAYFSRDRGLFRTCYHGTDAFCRYL